MIPDKKIIIRKYRPSDCNETALLFYNTVHTVNAADYTKEQLDAWAPEKTASANWGTSFREHYSIAAVCGDIIVGFGDIDRAGYLDRLYVHKDYQRRGIASALCDNLEQAVRGNIVTHASVTAKPFFEKRGYKTIKENQV